MFPSKSKKSSSKPKNTPGQRNAENPVHGRESEQQSYRGITRRLFIIGGIVTSVKIALKIAEGGCDSNTESDREPHNVSDRNTNDVSNPFPQRLPSPSPIPEITFDNTDFPLNNYTEMMIPLPDGNVFEEIVMLQGRYREIMESALMRFVDADERMPVILDFFRNRSFFSLPLGPVTTQMVFSEDTDMTSIDDRMENALEVVFMPAEFANSIPNAIVLQNEGHTLRIADEFRTQEWFAIRVAHELSHAYDQLVEGKDYSNNSEALAGEVRAHLLEMNLLRSWNEQAYNTLIEQGTPFYLSDDLGQLRNLAMYIYPLDPSLRESRLGIDSIIIAVAFEHALSQDASEADLMFLHSQLVERIARQIALSYL